jgi:hypothetical protein
VSTASYLVSLKVSPILFHRATHNFKPNKSSYIGINTKLEVSQVGRKTGGSFENRANLETGEAVYGFMTTNTMAFGPDLLVSAKL